MTSERQKKDERVHLELFRELFDESPMRLLSHGDNPDFLMECEGRTIGIEHTELVKRRNRSSKMPYDPAELDNIQKDIVRKARRLYVDQGNPPVSVVVRFHTTMRHVRLANGRKTAMAEELACLVARWVRENPSDSEVDLRRNNAMPEIDRVCITRGVSDWRKEGVSLLAPLSELISRLQEEIGKKNSRYDVYRRKCNECWLLIVADWTNPSQAFDLGRDNILQTHCFRSKFDRVFFLEVGHRRLIKLNHTVPDDASGPIE